MKKTFSALVVLLFSLSIYAQPRVKVENDENLSAGSPGTFYFSTEALNRLEKKSKLSRSEIPATYNLRDLGFTTSPISQKHTGRKQNAKALMFSVESKFIKEGIIPNTTQLSLQNLLWCPSYNGQLTPNEPAQWTNPVMAMIYFATEKGPLLNSQHPFVYNETKPSPTTKDIIDTCSTYSGIKPVRNIFEMVKLPFSINNNPNSPIHDDQAPLLYNHTAHSKMIKELVMEHGAIGARIVTLTENSLLDDNYCNETPIPTGVAGTSFNIIGWDDTYDCGCTSGKLGAWIIDRATANSVPVKNKRYLSYHNAEGFYEIGYFPTHEALDSERDLLYYDTVGWCASVGFDSNTPTNPYPGNSGSAGNIDSGYVTTKFNAGGRLIERVATYALGAETNLEVEVYSGKDSNNKLVGLLTKGKRKVDFPGHYVVKLEDTVYAQEFYVRVKYKTKDYKYVLPVEMKASTVSSVGTGRFPYSTPVVEKGVAWISSDPNDPFAYPIGIGQSIIADPCIKVFSRKRVDLRLRVWDHEKRYGDPELNYLDIMEWDGPVTLKSGHHIDFFGRKSGSSQEMGFHPGPDSLRVVDGSGVDVTTEYSYVPSLIGELNIHPKAPTSSIFKDNIWLFGEDEKGNMTSKGVEFVEKTALDGTKYYEARDFSNQSNVNAPKNSLSVGGINCESDILFYVSDDKVYNGKHKVIGTIKAKNNVVDGLTTAYVGNGKYLLACTNPTNATNNMHELNLYEVDINANNGKGSVTHKVKFAGNVGNFIRLVPKPDSHKKFWIITYFANYIAKYDVDGEDFSVSALSKFTNLGELSYTNLFSIQDIKISPDFKKLAIANKNMLHIYWMNAELLEWRHRKTISRKPTDTYFSMEFTQDSKNLLLTDTIQNKVFRLSIKDVYMLEDNYTIDSVTYSHKIGGLKSGMDNKMYIVTPNADNLKVLPESSISLATMLNPLKLNLNTKGKNDMKLSNGITLPWDDDPTWISTNTSDLLAVNDTVYAFWGDSIGVIPKLNDKGSNKTISSAHIIDAKHRTKSKIEFDKDSDTILFKVATDSIFTTQEIIRIEYILKNNATPFYDCSSAIINIKYIDLPNIRLLDSCSFAPTLSLGLYYKNFDIEWQVSDQKNGTYIKVTSATGTKCPATKKGYYKVKITNKHTKGVKYSEIVKLEIKETLIGKRTWYETSITVQ